MARKRQQASFHRRRPLDSELNSGRCPTVIRMDTMSDNTTADGHLQVTTLSQTHRWYKQSAYKGNVNRIFLIVLTKFILSRLLSVALDVASAVDFTAFMDSTVVVRLVSVNNLVVNLNCASNTLVYLVHSPRFRNYVLCLFNGLSSTTVTNNNVNAEPTIKQEDNQHQAQTTSREQRRLLSEDGEMVGGRCQRVVVNGNIRRYTRAATQHFNQSPTTSSQIANDETRLNGNTGNGKSSAKTTEHSTQRHKQPRVSKATTVT